MTIELGEDLEHNMDAHMQRYICLQILNQVQLQRDM